MQDLLHKIGTTSDATKKDSFGATFLEKFIPRIFLKFSTIRALSDIEHIFNKFNRGIVQKPDAVGT